MIRLVIAASSIALIVTAAALPPAAPSQGCTGATCTEEKEDPGTYPIGWSVVWGDETEHHPGKGRDSENPCAPCKKCTWEVTATFNRSGSTGHAVQCGNTSTYPNAGAWEGTLEEHCDADDCLGEVAIDTDGGTAVTLGLNCPCDD